MLQPAVAGTPLYPYSRRFGGSFSTLMNSETCAACWLAVTPALLQKTGPEVDGNTSTLCEVVVVVCSLTSALSSGWPLYGVRSV